MRRDLSSLAFDLQNLVSQFNWYKFLANERRRGAIASAVVEEPITMALSPHSAFENQNEALVVNAGLR